MKDHLLNRAIIICSTLFAVLLLVFIRLKLTSTPPAPPANPGLNSWPVAGLTIRTPGDENQARILADFLQKSLDSELMPSEISLYPTSDQNAVADPRQTLLGSFNKDGKFVQILVGLNPQKQIAYLRVWLSPEGKESQLTPFRSDTLISQLVNPAWRRSLPAITCQETTSRQTGELLTECSSIKTLDHGDLAGVTVRSPFTILPPPGLPLPSGTPPVQVTIIAACLIPKGQTAGYRSSVCE